MRRLSELPLPHGPHAGGPRVVTLGGGHGQAALLAALVQLECDVTAIVSVADDGGCSGKLREELGMPPPGDVRRCLVSLAADRAIAERLEERLRGGGEEGRCVGNLVLAEMRQDLGSLQLAVDWAGQLLGCRGRVVPVAEEPGILTVYDRVHGAVQGESNIERLSASALIATVDGPVQANHVATAAIEAADYVFLGPGSFVGSTLAVLTTADIARTVATASGRRVLVRNVRAEERTGFPGAVAFDDHERILRDHLVIGSGGETPLIDVLADAPYTAVNARDDGSSEWLAPLADPARRAHDPAALTAALELHFGLARARASHAPPPSSEARAIFERYLESARARLFSRSARVEHR
ncbi:MAG: 2-phospho-L-lactate transferase CofD family protein [Polyangiaceae bacterium]